MKQKLLYPLTLLLLLLGCKAGEHDYRYTVSNLCTQTDTITISFKVRDNNTLITRRLGYGDTLTLTRREGVKGDDVWDIETSTQIYKLTQLRAALPDSSLITDELSYRRLWTAPSDENGVGLYNLPITDEHFVLREQTGYQYLVQHTLSDTLIITSYLTNQVRRRDTIVGPQTILLGENTIYTYDEAYPDRKKYKQQKMSGLSTVALWHKEHYKNVNLKSDTTFFVVTETSCTLRVDSTLMGIKPVK